MKVAILTPLVPTVARRFGNNTEIIPKSSVTVLVDEAAWVSHGNHNCRLD